MHRGTFGRFNRDSTTHFCLWASQQINLQMEITIFSFRTFMSFNCKVSWLPFKAFDIMSYKMTAGMKCGSDPGADSE